MLNLLANNVKCMYTAPTYIYYAREKKKKTLRPF